MSYKMWAKYFSRDPHLLGQPFRLNGQRRTLVGIMPPRFTFLGADLWIPRDPDPADPAGRQQYYMFLGRMKSGMTMASVASEWDIVARRLAKVYPDAYPSLPSSSWIPRPMTGLMPRNRNVLEVIWAPSIRSVPSCVE